MNWPEAISHIIVSAFFFGVIAFTIWRFTR